MPPTRQATLLEQLGQLSKEADVYFQKIEETEGSPANTDVQSNPDLKGLLNGLLNDLSAINAEISKALPHSPLIGALERERLTHSNRRLASSFRCHEYQSWQERELSEEDHVFGILPAGEQELPVNAAAARWEFQNALSDLEGILPLLVQPPAKARTGNIKTPQTLDPKMPLPRRLFLEAVIKALREGGSYKDVLSALDNVSDAADGALEMTTFYQDYEKNYGIKCWSDIASSRPPGCK